jgi:hypothetical protein
MDAFVSVQNTGDDAWNSLKIWDFSTSEIGITILYEQKILPSVYGQLGHSHKVNLTSAPYEVKPKLVQESVENKYTVTIIRKRIREEKDKQRSDHIPLKDPMSIDRLKNLTSKQLNALKTKTEGLFKKVQDEAKVYQGNLGLIEQVLNSDNNNFEQAKLNH